jgi:hypothetical protein
MSYKDHAVHIELTHTEFHMAVSHAILTMTASAAENRNHRKTMDRDRLDILHHSVIGAIGEISVAKYLNKFFVPHLNAFHNIPDCFEDLEVRASDKNNALITRDDDAPDRKYIKVMTNGNKAIIVGWLFGHETRRNDWKRTTGRPCWMVPHEHLRPISTLNDPAFTPNESGEYDW